MVVSSMRQAQLEEEDTRFDTVWDKGIHILLKGVEDNYVGIRKSFLNAIKDVMVEESKKEDVPTVTWMRSQKVITDGE